MRHKRKPLHFVTPSGDDLYLYSVQALLKAVNRNDSITITQWEDAEIIPVSCNIYIKMPNTIKAARYYTERTIVKMKRLFGRGPKQRIMSPYRKMRIREIFEEQKEAFKDAKYIGKADTYKPRKTKKVETNLPEGRVFEIDDEGEETKDFFGTESDWSN